MTSVNDKIHDRLIEHDVEMRRVDGGRRKHIEAIIDELGSDLKAVMAKHDPFSVQRADAREIRMKKIDEAAGQLIAEAYGEISKLMMKDMKRLAKVESDRQVEAIREALP